MLGGNRAAVRRVPCYENNTKEIGGIYGNARKQHAAGINMLIREFDYHPPFKRHSDTFTAVPFNPKRV